MATRDSKIFGIGLSKTGTSSLAHALEILGYRTKDYLGLVRYTRGDLASVDLETVDANDALTDTPIPSFYRELDARYPNSKFILTVRDRDGWLNSCKKQFTQRLAEKQNEAHRRLFIDLYGTDVFDEQKFVSGYEKFLKEVLEYFKNRPEDLLVIDIAGGEGWESLCRFLDKPVPDVPFPKANVTQIRWVAMGDLVAVAKRAGDEILRVYNNRPGVAHPGHGDRFSGNVAGGAPAAIGKFSVGRAVYAMRGGDQGAQRRAAERANRVILNGLRKLSPQTPIVSRVGARISDAERAKSNHLWLVDPLGGVNHHLGAESEVTVSVALIEDGKAIYGVVYAPFADTVYYGRVGQGAHKIEQGRGAQKIETRTNGSSQPRAAPNGQERSSGRDRSDHRLPTTSCALAICTHAADGVGIYSCPGPTMEWETAAAHAIASALGKRVYDCRSNEELKYNKKDLVNRCFMVD